MPEKDNNIITCDEKYVTHVIFDFKNILLCFFQIKSILLG